jgi:hypothetical protein
VKKQILPFSTAIFPPVFLAIWQKGETVNVFSDLYFELENYMKKEEKCDIYEFQCCGSMEFWYGSVPLTNGSGTLVHLHNSLKIMDGFGSASGVRSVLVTNGSGYGSGRPRNIPTYPTDPDPQHCWIPFVHLSLSYCSCLVYLCNGGYLSCCQVGSVLVLRDPAVLVTLKMEYVNITLNNILSIYRSEHNSDQSR